jgi:hypothetical protein
MESAFPREKLVKRSHLQLLLNGWHITRGMQPKRIVLCLESYGYNKSNSDPKFTASLILDEHKHFLVCSKSLLDFLK